MITIKRDLLLAIFILSVTLLSVSCSKDDDNNSNNKQTEIGPAGKDGSVIYSGEGAPSDNIGVTGDYYFDIETGNLYGPKMTNSSWAEANVFSLRGEKGISGNDGCVILSGMGAPGMDIGRNGDFYLDKENYTLYGPKLTTGENPGWGAGLMLKGAEGNANVRTFVLNIGKDDWTFYSNTPVNIYKNAKYRVAFPALSKDIYDNGIVMVYWEYMNQKHPLPYVRYTFNKNILRKTFCVDYRSGVEDNECTIMMVETLQAYVDKTEIITFAGPIKYHINVITGKPAETLSAFKDDPEEMYRVATEIGLTN